MPWACDRTAETPWSRAARGSGRTDIPGPVNHPDPPNRLVAQVPGRGVVLMAVGGALLSGWAQALVALGGAVVFVFALVVGWQEKSWDRDRMREPPMPPGGGAPIEI